MINRNLAKVLSFRYKIIALVLVMLASGLVLLPKYEKHEGISPEQLLSNAISPERYISTDELADKLINQDPSFLLIDVRDEESFKKYNLPYAINIPLEKLLDEESEGYLNQDEYDIILYSNDNFYADQAWIICNRLDYKNHRVLKGGINKWFTTIINPEKPTEDMPKVAFDLYSFRKAASMYFGVAYPEQVQPAKNTKSKPTKRRVTVRKKKKMAAEGGC